MNITNPNGLFTDAGSIPAEPTIRFHGRIEPAVKALFRYFCFTRIGSIQGLISHSL